MDVPRIAGSRRRRGRLLGLGAAAVVVAAAVFGLTRLRAAPPIVDESSVWIDTVRSGAMDIQIHGVGQLVPQESQWVTARTAGRVTERPVLAGTAVKPYTVLLVLSNPLLVQETQQAEWQLKQAQAQYDSLAAQLASQVLNQRGLSAKAQSDYLQARIEAETDRRLADEGLGPEVTAQLSASKAEAAKTNAEIAKEQIRAMQQSMDAQLAAQQAQIEQARASYSLRRSELEALAVRAGVAGTVEQVPVEVGQEVAAGAVLAKIVEPNHLIAELEISQNQAQRIRLGQQATINTPGGVIPGVVTRIDPSVRNDTRTVDVTPDAALPPGAVPQLSVDGTIEIEHLDDATYVGRPALAQPQSTISLFKLVNGGRDAMRTRVRVGLVSVDSIQILDGLRPGDRVILSDMSRWDGVDRIRLR